MWRALCVGGVQTRCDLQLCMSIQYVVYGACKIYLGTSSCRGPFGVRCSRVGRATRFVHRVSGFGVRVLGVVRHSWSPAPLAPSLRRVAVDFCGLACAMATPLGAPMRTSWTCV